MRAGIDIGGTSSHGIVVCDDGVVRAERVIATGQGPHAVLDATEDLVHHLVREVGATGGLGPLRGVGVGIPGRVSPDVGHVENALNLGITSLALGPLLGRRLGVDVVVDNDVKATALGAVRHFEAQATSLTYVNVGTGVAAATVVHGHLLRGSSNMAGEVGHLPIDPGGPVCTCGQTGCLEAILGGRNLQRRQRELHRTTDEALMPVEQSASTVHALVRALILATVAYDSELLVVGGGVLSHAHGLLEEARRTLDEQARTSPFLRTLDIGSRIRSLPCGTHVAALGAAMLPAGAAGGREVGAGCPG